MRSLTGLESETVKAFNLSVRLVETNIDGVGLCCCCGRPYMFYDLQAGHFITAKHRPTRFNRDNVHVQCVQCNHFDTPGAVPKYEVYMIKRYGQEFVDSLRATSKGTMSKTERYNECLAVLEESVQLIRALYDKVDLPKYALKWRDKKWHTMKTFDGNRPQ